MGIIILFIIILISGIICLLINKDSFGGLLTTVFSAAVLCTLIISLMCINMQWENQIQNYQTFKETIEYYRSNNFSELERINLIEITHENNKMINAHKLWHDNFWVGIWYTEKIGNLEHLK